MKAILQLLAAILVAVTPLATGDHHLSTVEWINILLVGLGAATVYIAGNLPTGVWQLTKTIMSGLQAGAVVLVSALTDGGLNSTEWVQSGLAVLAVWAVYQIPPRGAVSTGGRHRAGALVEDQAGSVEGAGGGG
jgi:hypothetical protein